MAPSNGFDARMAVMEGNVTHVTPAERLATVEDKSDLILQALIERSSDCNPMDSHHHHAGKNVSLNFNSTALSHTDVHSTTAHTYNGANLQWCNSAVVTVGPDLARRLVRVCVHLRIVCVLPPTKNTRFKYCLADSTRRGG